MSASKPIFLDVDSSIVENNLRFTNKESDAEFSRIFGNQAKEYPSKLVKPRTGKFSFTSQEMQKMKNSIKNITI